MRPSSRAAALVVAVAIFLAHAAALHHETSIAHVRDGLTGLVSHAHAMTESHAASAASDIHGRQADHVRDLEDCAIAAGLEQVTIISALPLSHVARAPLPLTQVARAATAPPAATPLLLLAPKTSPPTCA